MYFLEATLMAIRVSLKEGCVQHVNSLLNDKNEVDPRGYYVSDWVDGTTVASFERGKRING